MLHQFLPWINNQSCFIVLSPPTETGPTLGSHRDITLGLDNKKYGRVGITGFLPRFRRSSGPYGVPLIKSGVGTFLWGFVGGGPQWCSRAFSLVQDSRVGCGPGPLWGQSLGFPGAPRGSGLGPAVLVLSQPVLGGFWGATFSFGRECSWVTGRRFRSETSHRGCGYLGTVGTIAVVPRRPHLG